MIKNEKIGEDLKQIRENMGLSAEQLSRVLSVSHTSIYNWEKGKNSPSQLAMEKLQKLLLKQSK